MKSDLLGGYDLVLLVYPESKTMQTKIRLQDRQNQLESLFKKAGLLK